MKLLQHHVKYKEIHGEDKIVLMDYSTHRKLHNKLRRDGKCNIPYDKLDEIVHKAHERSPLRKEHHRITSSRYNKDNIKRFEFTDTLIPFVHLRELWIYNSKTENICVVSGFRSTKGTHLFEINESELI